MAKLIVLDPGHFKNHNRGATAGYFEGNWMLVYARYLEAELKALGFDVLLTRYDGKDLSLTDRGRLAVRKKAELFYSLHSNACSVPRVRRVTVFYSVDRPDDLAFAREIANTVARVMGSPYGVATTRASTVHHSKPDPSTKEDYYTVIDTASDGGVAHVLLTEHDFHTNPDVCRWLVQRLNLQKMAKAEAQVIRKYLAGVGGQTPDKPAGTYHTVVRGDTLSAIGRKYGVPWRDIASKNGVTAPWIIRSGDVLLIQ